jgi:hypothetical protein
MEQGTIPFPGRQTQSIIQWVAVNTIDIYEVKAVIEHKKSSFPLNEKV